MKHSYHFHIADKETEMEALLVYVSPGLWNYY